jgi:hypothetical protein
VPCTPLNWGIDAGWMLAKTWCFCLFRALPADDMTSGHKSGGIAGLEAAPRSGTVCVSLIGSGNMIMQGRIWLGASQGVVACFSRILHAFESQLDYRNKHNVGSDFPAVVAPESFSRMPYDGHVRRPNSARVHPDGPQITPRIVVFSLCWHSTAHVLPGDGDWARQDNAANRRPRDRMRRVVVQGRECGNCR